VRRLAWFSLVPGLVWPLLPLVLSGDLGPVDEPFWLLPAVALVGEGFIAFWTCHDWREIPLRLVLLWAASGLVMSVYVQPKDVLGLAVGYAYATPLALFWLGLPLLGESVASQVLDRSSDGQSPSARPH
jgi:hypothetical protein